MPCLDLTPGPEFGESSHPRGRGSLDGGEDRHLELDLALNARGYGDEARNQKKDPAPPHNQGSYDGGRRLDGFVSTLLARRASCSTSSRWCSWKGNLQRAASAFSGYSCIRMWYRAALATRWG